MQDLFDLFDLYYMKAVEALKETRQYFPLKRLEAVYKVYQINKNAKKKRLRGEGPLDGMMFIGVNPSVRSKLASVWEDPFGKYFSEFLSEAGIDPKKIYFTNIYKEPTPENRPITTEEAMEGREELVNEITAVNPKVIVCLGKQVSNFLPMVADQFMREEIEHPSYINRNRAFKGRWINRLKEIKEKYEKTGMG